MGIKIDLLNLMEYRTPGADKDCTRCKFSTGNAIHSYSPVEYKNVLLMIIAAYPGEEELKIGRPLVPTTIDKVDNTGKFLRGILKLVIDQDKEIDEKYKPIIHRSLLANAIRCKVGEERITKKELNKCSYWLERDLDNLNPKVPILLSGSEAVKAVLGYSEKLFDNRRYIKYKDKHPVIITENLVNGLRSLTYRVEKKRKRRDGIEVPIKGYTKINKPFIGSAAWHLVQDLELLKEEIKIYIKETYE